MLDVPSTVTEFHGEPVEQFGVSGPLAHDAKVFRGFDDTGPKEFVPHAVDGYARGVRVCGADTPLRQGEPVVRLAGLQWGQKVRSIGLYAFGASSVNAARQHVRVGERGFLPTHLRQIAAGR